MTKKLHYNEWELTIYRTIRKPFDYHGRTYHVTAAWAHWVVRWLRVGGEDLYSNPDKIIPSVLSVLSLRPILWTRGDITPHKCVLRRIDDFNENEFCDFFDPSPILCQLK